MDVQPRAPQHGARWHHAINETGDGRIVPLLAVVKSGRITGLYAGLLLPWKRGGRGGRQCIYNLFSGIALAECSQPTPASLVGADPASRFDDMPPQPDF